MDILKSIFNFFANPVADLTGGYRERKHIASEMAANIATAECNLQMAKFNAEARRLDNQAGNDSDYDLQVLKNRKETYMDELIIAVFLGLFIAHFIPALQPYMADGRQAMGYNGAPWYFEFIVVGIAVSTLGVMRLFKAFWGARKPNV